jgi:hypothetical protein
MDYPQAMCSNLLLNRLRNSRKRNVQKNSRNEQKHISEKLQPSINKLEVIY